VSFLLNWSRESPSHFHDDLQRLSQMHMPDGKNGPDRGRSHASPKGVENSKHRISQVFLFFEFVAYRTFRRLTRGLHVSVYLHLPQTLVQPRSASARYRPDICRSPTKKLHTLQPNSSVTKLRCKRQSRIKPDHESSCKDAGCHDSLDLYRDSLITESQPT
jgi:hypothetical protein